MTKEQLRPYTNRKVRMLLCSNIITQGNEWVEGTLVYITCHLNRGSIKSYYLLHNTQRWCGGNLNRNDRGDYSYDWSVRGGYSSDIMSHGIKPIKNMIKHRMTQ